MTRVRTYWPRLRGMGNRFNCPGIGATANLGCSSYAEFPSYVGMNRDETEFSKNLS